MIENMAKECTLGQMVQDLMATLKMTRKKGLEHSHSQVVIYLRCVQLYWQLINKQSK